MKRHLFLILFMLEVFPGITQVNYQTVADRFQQFYNQELADSIFNMYAPVMKEHLPQEKNRTVMSGLHIQFGELRSLGLLKQDTGYARYKASFKDQTLTMVLALNKENLIEGLRFIPYNPEPAVEDKTKPVSNIFLKTFKGNISGTLLVPEGKQKLPVVLIIAGSGPTDRNGNQDDFVHTNAYQMVADSLSKKGIATLRYDKRGIGESAAAMGSESDLSFDDGINDAAAFIQMLKADTRFSKVIVLGHSEGSLVGMVAAGRAKADGYISVAGPGERADKLIVQQLNAQSPSLAAKARILFDSLISGYTVDPPADLLMILRPSVQPYIKSWLKYDPQLEIKKLKIPVLIIQGTTDLQVSVQNAHWLKAADPSATLVIVEQMNHVLKNVGADTKENTATYTNPALPIMTEMVKAIEKFIYSIH
jgi:alpha/beta superfamily hydrolase